MRYIPHNLILLLAIIYATDLRAGCNSPNANMVTVEITKPTGDPTTTAGANSDNERTYSSASTPTVTVVCTAKDIPQEDEDYLRWTIEDVGSIKAKWNPHVAGDEYTGKGESATATYTGLPSNYDDFGKKKITLTLNGGVSAADCKDETYVEIFFPRDEKNHPGTGSGTTPNWFYYWGQAIGNPQNLVYQSGAGYGAVKAMTQWGYNKTLALKNEITIHDLNGFVDSGEILSKNGKKKTTGIAVFWDTYKHESEHIRQITVGDGMLNISSGTPWENGWSWNNIGNDNHWQIGADNVPGIKGVDDDSDGNVDNLLNTGRGELGHSNSTQPTDDLDQDTLAAAQEEWPDALGTPPVPPFAGGWAVEQLAYDAEPDDETAFARSDWGKPGKNHKTIDKFDD